MAGRGGDHVRVRREGGGHVAGLVGGLADHGEVGVERGEPRQQLVAVLHREADADARVQLPEGRHDPREEVVPGVDDRHVEEPPLEAPQLGDGLLRPADVAEDPARMQEHLLALLREAKPPPRPLEERRPRVALELLHLDGDRRRREVQLLGRAREREVARGALEDPQLPQRGVFH